MSWLEVLVAALAGLLGGSWVIIFRLVKETSTTRPRQGVANAHVSNLRADLDASFAELRDRIPEFKLAHNVADRSKSASDSQDARPNVVQLSIHDGFTFFVDGDGGLHLRNHLGYGCKGLVHVSAPSVAAVSDVEANGSKAVA